MVITRIYLKKTLLFFINYKDLLQPCFCLNSSIVSNLLKRLFFKELEVVYKVVVIILSVCQRTIFFLLKVSKIIPLTSKPHINRWKVNSIERKHFNITHMQESHRFIFTFIWNGWDKNTQTKRILFLAPAFKLCLSSKNI